ncbi:CD225/dispanin family protein [Aeromicrobium sp.]|uniref:CD225/dispanin family protein n=1 Tax=Aeromicrobium sp. TaxID=1871063 RepID=UPI003D6C3DBB
MSTQPPPPPPPPPSPGEYPGPSMGQKPPSNLVWGILTTLFCCLPFGIVSIVYAARVDGKWSGGDAAGAQADSDNAKKWAIIAALSGVAVIVLYVIVVIAFGVSMSGDMSGSEF